MVEPGVIATDLTLWSQDSILFQTGWSPRYLVAQANKGDILAVRDWQLKALQDGLGVRTRRRYHRVAS